MSRRAPLYPTLLRLKNVHPNGWQRALLGEGAIVAAGLLVLADVATAWALLVVPLAVALVVKAHDVMTGLLRGPRGAAAPEQPQQGRQGAGATAPTAAPTASPTASPTGSVVGDGPGAARS